MSAPAITTDDGFRIQLDQEVGGFHLFAPGGQLFAWAEDEDQALAKIGRERREQLWHSLRAS